MALPGGLSAVLSAPEPLITNCYYNQALPTGPFLLSDFLAAVERAPLHAKALFLQGIADGIIQFPNGTTADSYEHLVVAPVLHLHPAAADSPRLQKLYGAALTDTTSDSWPTKFPLAYVFELLERLANGEHPQFVEWAAGFFEVLLTWYEPGPDGLISYHGPQ